jgi:predicted TIM-barrel fold metal-dependent hydrolase
MTIDSHMHVGNISLFPGLDPSGLEDAFRRFDIAAGMVFSPDNALVREVVEAIPAAYGLYWANPKAVGCVEEAEEYLGHPKFLGMKMHPLLEGYHPNDPITHPLIELLIRKDMPVLIHCGHPIFTLPWSIEELVVEYPSAKVILGHMGHGNIVYINGSIDVAARNPNVYLETSGMPMHTKILEAVERVGPEKVLYGSDVPCHDPRVEMLKVRVSGLSEELVERVLHKNAEQLFFHGSLSNLS